MMKPEVNLDGLMHEMAWRSSDKLCPLPMMSGNPPVHCLGHKCAKWNPHYGGCCDGTAYLTQDAIGSQIHQLSNLILAQSNRLCDLMQTKGE